MKPEYTKLLTDIIRQMSRTDHVRTADIPNIDLYMDQVTHFMDEHLDHSKRHEEDKILTKTMINNYAKNDLLPPPVKKKYSKDHMLLLIFIYYLKNIMSIGDIQTLLNPISDQYFHNNGDIPLTEIYTEIMNYLKQEQNGLFQYVKNEFRASEKLFTETSADIPEEEREELRHFAFICFLAFDIYLKKLMIETLLDDTQDAAQKKENKDKKE